MVVSSLVMSLNNCCLILVYFIRVCVYTPQQNGIVERKHKTILDMARSFRFQATIPLRFWVECVTTTVYLINRQPSRTLGYKSPFEMLYLHSPSLQHLGVFDCLCYAACPSIVDKFSPGAVPTVFLGYSSSQKGYVLYDWNAKSFFVNRNVVFQETIISLQAYVLFRQYCFSYTGSTILN